MLLHQEPATWTDNPSLLCGPTVILAIVGSIKFLNPNAYALALPEVVAAVSQLQPMLIISGDADGLDSFAKAFAVTSGCPYRGFPPTNARWAPHGYKERNLLIADCCTHLLAIRCQGTNTYGSGFTTDAAAKLGRIVRRVTIPIAGDFVRAEGDWRP